MRVVTLPQSLTGTERCLAKLVLKRFGLSTGDYLDLISLFCKDSEQSINKVLDLVLPVLEQSLGIYGQAEFLDRLCVFSKKVISTSDTILSDLEQAMKKAVHVFL